MAGMINTTLSKSLLGNGNRTTVNITYIGATPPSGATITVSDTQNIIFPPGPVKLEPSEISGIYIAKFPVTVTGKTGDPVKFSAKSSDNISMPPYVGTVTTLSVTTLNLTIAADYIPAWMTGSAPRSTRCSTRLTDVNGNPLGSQDVIVWGIGSDLDEDAIAMSFDFVNQAGNVLPTTTTAFGGRTYQSITLSTATSGFLLLNIRPKKGVRSGIIHIYSMLPNHDLVGTSNPLFVLDPKPSGDYLFPPDILGEQSGYLNPQEGDTDCSILIPKALSKTVMGYAITNIVQGVDTLIDAKLANELISDPFYPPDNLIYKFPLAKLTSCRDSQHCTPNDLNQLRYMIFEKGAHNISYSLALPFYCTRPVPNVPPGTPDINRPYALPRIYAATFDPGGKPVKGDEIKNISGWMDDAAIAGGGVIVSIPPQAMLNTQKIQGRYYLNGVNSNPIAGALGDRRDNYPLLATAQILDPVKGLDIVLPMSKLAGYDLGSDSQAGFWVEYWLDDPVDTQHNTRSQVFHCRLNTQPPIN